MILGETTGRRYAQLKCINRNPPRTQYEGKEIILHTNTQNAGIQIGSKLIQNK